MCNVFRGGHYSLSMSCCLFTFFFPLSPFLSPGLVCVCIVCGGGGMSGSMAGMSTFLLLQQAITFTHHLHSYFIFLFFFKSLFKFLFLNVFFFYYFMRKRLVLQSQPLLKWWGSTLVLQYKNIYLKKILTLIHIFNLYNNIAVSSWNSIVIGPSLKKNLLCNTFDPTGVTGHLRQ